MNAVDDVSFEVRAGETFGLVGESGSGKSTTARAILRLVPVSAGTITFGGVDVTGMGRHTPLSYRRDVQAVFQDPWSSLNPRKVIGATLGDPLRRHGHVHNAAEQRRRTIELLDQVGLASYYVSRYPSELSGGQRQRVAIARALAVEPRFIVCDEAVSALDVSTQSQVINLLQDLQEHFGLTYLFIAHDLGVVRHISHRVGVMQAGKLVETGAGEEIFRDPKHPYTQTLLNAVLVGAVERNGKPDANGCSRQQDSTRGAATLPPRGDRMKDAQARMDDLAFAPGEDPFVVTHGGFYRRWLAMIEDLAMLQETVSRLTGTTDDVWVPAWRDVGLRYENEGDQLEAAGRPEAARQAHLQAKTYYAIARFPTASTPLKEAAHRDCVRAYLKACAHLDPPLEVVEVECAGRRIVAHYRRPSVASPDTPVPATLIMCGGDVFKEDRGWAGAFALEHGLASLVMDAPGTGENSFPHAPESVEAWMAAIDWLAARPEVDRERVGAFGISRGGYSVMLLAGSYPKMVKAAVAIAGNHFGYRMSPEETAAVVDMKNKRSTYVYGAPGDGPTFPRTSAEQEEADFRRWSLTELGVIDAITCPVLMINGKRDHLAPIGNIYFMLENGPVTGKEARVYPDDGHCAFKHFDEWGNASFCWLTEKLAHPMVRY